MKTILLLLLASIILRAQQFVEVTFRIEANNIPESTKVYIAGNQPALGNWDPGKISLINTYGNFWERTCSFPVGKEIQFKLTLGSWEREAVNEDGSIPKNIVFKPLSDTVVQEKVNKWKTEALAQRFVGQVTGHLEYIRNLTGEGLLPRDIIIWLPPAYFNDTSQRYPVLFMQDGQNLFDPSTSAFGVDWQLDETADSLIRQGRIDPIIIVGISNTRWRSSEYTENDTGLAYMKFVVQKVKPLIDSSYRTINDPRSNAVGGSSYGGMISFMLAWNYPEIFSMAMCVSPALKVYKRNYIDNVQKYLGKRKPLKFYFDAGLHSLDSILIPGLHEMVRVLEEKGYINGSDILEYEDEHGEHNESSWAARAWRPLLFFFGRR